MAEVRARRLDQPRGPRGRLLTPPRLPPETVGRFAERIARLLGTGRFLVVQTVGIVIWITLNAALDEPWDRYPFILLTLVLSVQAAYAAPLILLAQNRQDDRDRVSLEQDRLRAERTRAETEYLARELAALRLSVGEVVTRDYLRSELTRLVDQLANGQGESEADRSGHDRPTLDGSGKQSRR